MKNKRTYTAAATILMLSAALFSCKKSFLEVNPKGRLIAHTVNDYNGLLNNLDLLNMTNSTAQIMMGDDVAAIEPYYSGATLKTQRLFRWDALIYQQDEDASEILPYLSNIYIFNKLINEVPDATEGTEAQKQSVIAEARASRAWSYFMLINYFGKPYNAATSATDPGFPIVTATDVTETGFTRASVKEVYDFILSDLTAAIPNLPARTTHRLRMSRAAAEGLLGKVHVFMGNFSAALPVLNASITDISGSAVPLGLYDYNVTFATGGAFLPVSIFGPSQPTIVNNQEVLLGKQVSNGWASYSNAELVLAPATFNLYNPSDLRLNFFSTTPYAAPAYPAGLRKRSGPGIALLGIGLPDIYLLRAECKARLNDLAGAVTDLQTLRSRRMPASVSAVPANIAGQQTLLIRYVIEERRREFAVIGNRWFDMRRLSVDPIFAADTYTHTLLSDTGTPTATYTLSPDRYVLRLPAKVINQNPGMQDNP